MRIFFHAGKSGIRLDWIRRLRISLGTAKGLVYLHELANPPIIHRDIKSTNVLLDDHLDAKVADFGLSKLMGEGDKDHVSTEVKGTMVSIVKILSQEKKKKIVFNFLKDEGVKLLQKLKKKKNAFPNFHYRHENTTERFKNL